MPSNHVRRERKETIERLKFCGWLPAKTASTAMLLVNLFVSSIGGEAQ
ncbi:hypothetical protein T09_11492 [Trichinella sp. T9]|nr:hypothetical protein T09_11492 [Trichinella sp. T9]